MKNLILIRHSKTQQVPDISSHKWTISDEGVDLARQLSEQLAEYKIEMIFSSHEKKTKETANIFKERLNLPSVIELDGVEETRRGEVPYFADHNEFGARVIKAMENKSEILFGDESFENALNRFIKAIDSITRQYPNAEYLAVVSHGTVISLYLEHLTKIKARKFWKAMPMPAYYIWNREKMELWPGITACPVRTFK